jgi:SAM-dependent methyltransferase
MLPTQVPGARGYVEQSADLIPQYEAISFEARHAAELHLFPRVVSRVLDIGAGTGVDAAWFAHQGHSVLAVEPTDAFRTAGRELHPSTAIEWLDDALPKLERVLTRGAKFDVVMLSAVWMHLDESGRRDGMPQLVSLLASTGLLVLTLRHGPLPTGRCMYQVSAKETVDLAQAYGLETVLRTETESSQPLNRAAGVTWTHLAFRHAAAATAVNAA